MSRERNLTAITLYQSKHEHVNKYPIQSIIKIQRIDLLRISIY